MKTLKQTIFNGKEGNCFAACIATVFEVGLDEVPNFAAFGSEWWDKLQDWLKPRNLAFIELEAKGGEMPAIPLLPDGVLCLACGMAARGFNNSVVVKYRSRDGKHWVELVHDPHPSDDGLQDTKYIGWFMVIDPSKPIRSVSTQNRRKQ